MNFKLWLAEWEGNNFSQEGDLVNGPQYSKSKYKGPYHRDQVGELGDVNQKFGFSRDDQLLKLNKMKKKMKRR